MSMINLNKVTKSYGRKTVLKDFSLQIEKGEMIAVTGPSGCGKSTLLNIIGLLEDVDSGSLAIAGYENPRSSAALSNKILRRHINYLFQSYALVDEKTVEYNLRLALSIQRGSRKNKNVALDGALERVGLGGLDVACPATPLRRA